MFKKKVQRLIQQESDRIATESAEYIGNNYEQYIKLRGQLQELDNLHVILFGRHCEYTCDYGGFNG